MSGLAPATVSPPSSGITPGQRRQIWDSLLDADLSARYWRRIIKRYQHYNLGILIAILCISSGATADLMGWLNVEWLSKTWPVLVTGLSVAMLALDFSGRIEKMTDLVGKWTGLMYSYENLWNALPQTSPEIVVSQMRDLQERHAELSRSESGFPDSIDSVKKRVSREVRDSRGLLKPNEV